MKKLGKNLLFFGVGSMVLSLIHMQFILLAWIDLWGDTVGWAIRVALVLAGVVCWLIGKSQEESAAQA